MKLTKTLLLTSALFAGNALFAADKPVVESSWLRNHLPEKITAYIRIPHPMFMFATDDTQINVLQQDKNYIESIHKIKNQLITRIDSIQSLSDEQKIVFNALLSHLRAPIEVAIGEIEGMEKPPSVIIATKLDYTNTQLLIDDLKKVLHDSPVTYKLHSETTGEIAFPGSIPKGYFEYQADTGKLLIVFAETPSDWLDTINQTTKIPSPINHHESLIDESGQGLFATMKVHPMMFMFVPPQHANVIQKLGLSQIKEIAFGMGVANQRPQFKALIDMPKVGIRNMIPAYPMVTSAHYYGQFDRLFSISLPNAELFNQYISGLVKEEADEFNKVNQELKQKLGLTFDDIFNILGHNFSFVKDDSGSYVVTDITFDSDISQLIKNMQNHNIALEITEKNINGVNIKHLDLMPLLWYLKENADNKKNAANLELLRFYVNTHLYWTIDKDAVVISGLPQPLVASKQLKPSGTLQSVLNKNHINNQAHFISSVGNMRNLSQRAYYQKLKLLNFLGDITQTPVNIEQYAPANKLSLPQYGALSFNIDNNGDYLSFSVSTENGLVDILTVMSDQLYGQYTSIAFVGVIAAVAIPAYLNYTHRVKLTSAVDEIQPLKWAITETLAEGTDADTIDDSDYQDIILKR